MLYGNFCFRPRVIGCTFELAGIFVLQAYFVYESFTIAGLSMGKDFLYYRKFCLNLQQIYGFCNGLTTVNATKGG